MTRRIEFTVPDEIGAAYDDARGLVPMATWIKAVLERDLDRNGPPTEVVARVIAKAERNDARRASAKTRDQLAMERQRKLNERKS